MNITTGNHLKFNYNIYTNNKCDNKYHITKLQHKLTTTYSKYKHTPGAYVRCLPLKEYQEKVKFELVRLRKTLEQHAKNLPFRYDEKEFLAEGVKSDSFSFFDLLDRRQPGYINFDLFLLLRPFIGQNLFKPIFMKSKPNNKSKKEVYRKSTLAEQILSGKIFVKIAYVHTFKTHVKLNWKEKDFVTLNVHPNYSNKNNLKVIDLPKNLVPSLNKETDMIETADGMWTIPECHEVKCANCHTPLLYNEEMLKPWTGQPLHCGMCGLVINVKFEQINSILDFWFDDNNISNKDYIFGLLNELKQINVVDSLDYIDPELINNIIKHDLWIVNRFIESTGEVTVRLNSNLDSDLQNSIAESYSVLLVNRSITLNDAYPVINTHNNCMLRKIKRELSCPITVYGWPHSHVHLNDAEYSIQTSKFLTPSGARNDAIIYPAAVVFAAHCNFDMNEALAISNKHDTVIVVAPTSLDNEFYKNDGQRLFISPNSNAIEGDVSFLNNLNCLSMKNAQNTISTFIPTYTNKVLTQFSFISRKNKELYINDLKVIQNKENIKLNFESKHDLFNIGLPTNKAVHVDGKLFRSLNLYNLDGERSLKDLLVYAVGHSYVKFIYGDELVRNEKNPAHSLLLHCVLSWCMMKHINSGYSFSNMLSRNKLLFLLKPKIVDNLFSAFKDLTHKYLPKLTTSMVYAWSNILPNLTENSYELLLNITLNQKFSSLRKVDNINLKEYDHSDVCSHDKKTHKLTESKDKFTCPCCLRLVSEDYGSKCLNCKDHILDFDLVDPSEEDWDHYPQPELIEGIREKHSEYKNLYHKKVKNLKAKEYFEMKTFKNSSHLARNPIKNTQSKENQPEVKIRFKVNEDLNPKIVVKNNSDRVTVTRNDTKPEIVKKKNEEKLNDQEKTTDNSDTKYLIKNYSSNHIYSKKMSEFLSFHENFKESQVPLEYCAYIPFVDVGVHQLKRGYLKVVETKDDLINTEKDSCGYECLRFFDDKLTLDELRSFSGDKNNFSAMSMINLWFIKNRNLVIITSSFTYLSKNADNDKFDCIFHTGSNEKGHYRPAKSILLKPHDLYFSNPNLSQDDREIIWTSLDFQHKNGKLSSQFTYHDNYFVETQQLVTLKDKAFSNQFKLITNQNEFYLTNNDDNKHNLHFGLVYVNIPKQDYKTLNLLIQTKTELADKTFNIDETQPKNMTNTIESHKHELLYQLSKTNYFNPSNLSLLKMNLMQTPIEIKLQYLQNKAYLISNIPRSLKALDLIWLKENGVMQPYYLQSDKKGLFIASNTAKKTTTMMYTKISQSSHLKMLLFLMNTKFHNLDYSKRIKRTVLGAPGTGKTTEIVKLMNKKLDKSLAVTITGPSKNNLANKVNKPNRVKTLERTLMDKTHTELLIIDEATQFNWYTLYLLCSAVEPQEIMLFGDPSQVGYKDMFASSGVRNLTKITSMDINAEKWTNSYRLPKKICNILNLIGVDVQSVSQKEGEVIHIVLNKPLTPEEVKSLAGEHKVDLVLVPYNKTKNELQSLVRVEKIHAYQGNECESAMVYMCPLHRSQGLCKSKEYVVSAISRVKNKLVYVSVNSYQKPYDWFSIVDITNIRGSMISSKDNMTLYDIIKMVDNYKKLIPIDLPFNIEHKDNDLLIKHKQNPLLNITIKSVKGEVLSNFSSEYVNKSLSILGIKLDLNQKPVFISTAKFIHLLLHCMNLNSIKFVLNGFNYEMKIAGDGLFHGLFTIEAESAVLAVMFINPITMTTYGYNTTNLDIIGFFTEQIDAVQVSYTTLELRWLHVKSLYNQVLKWIKNCIPSLHQKMSNWSLDLTANIPIQFICYENKWYNFSYKIKCVNSMHEICTYSYRELYEFISIMNDQKTNFTKGAVKGLILPIDIHQQRNTIVAKTLTSRLGQIKVRQSMNTYNVIWTSKNTSEALSTSFKFYYNNSFLEVSDVLFDNVPALLVSNFFGLYKHHSKYSHKWVFITTVPVHYRVNANLMNNLTFYETSNDLLNSFVDSEYNKITSIDLRHENNMKKKVGKAVKNLMFNDDSKLFIDLSAICLSANSLADLLDKSAELQIVLPSSDNVVKNEIFELTGDKLICTHSSLVLKISEWARRLMSSKTKVILIKNNYVRFDVMAKAFDLTLYKLTIIEQQLPSHLVIDLDLPTELLAVSVIKANFSLKNIMSGTIFSSETRVVDSKLILSLKYRMLVQPNVTLKELIHYARVLGSTFECKAVGKVPLRKDNVIDIVHACNAVYQMHSENFSLIINSFKMLDSVKDENVMTKMLKEMFAANIPWLLDLLVSSLGLPETLVQKIQDWQPSIGKFLELVTTTNVNMVNHSSTIVVGLEMGNEELLDSSMDHWGEDDNDEKGDGEKDDFLNNEDAGKREEELFEEEEPKHRINRDDPYKTNKDSGLNDSNETQSIDSDLLDLLDDSSLNTNENFKPSKSNDVKSEDLKDKKVKNSAKKNEVVKKKTNRKKWKTRNEKMTFKMNNYLQTQLVKPEKCEHLIVPDKLKLLIDSLSVGCRNCLNEGKVDYIFSSELYSIDKNTDIYTVDKGVLKIDEAEFKKLEEKTLIIANDKNLQQANLFEFLDKNYVQKFFVFTEYEGEKYSDNLVKTFKIENNQKINIGPYSFTLNELQFHVPTIIKKKNNTCLTLLHPWTNEDLIVHSKSLFLHKQILTINNKIKYNNSRSSVTKNNLSLKVYECMFMSDFEETFGSGLDCFDKVLKDERVKNIITFDEQFTSVQRDWPKMLNSLVLKNIMVIFDGLGYSVTPKPVLILLLSKHELNWHISIVDKVEILKQTENKHVKMFNFSSLKTLSEQDRIEINKSVHSAKDVIYMDDSSLTLRRCKGPVFLSPWNVKNIIENLSDCVFYGNNSEQFFNLDNKLYNNTVINPLSMFRCKKLFNNEDKAFSVTDQIVFLGNKVPKDKSKLKDKYESLFNYRGIVSKDQLIDLYNYDNFNHHWLKLETKLSSMTNQPTLLGEPVTMKTLLLLDLTRSLNNRFLFLNDKLTFKVTLSDKLILVKNAVFDKLNIKMELKNEQYLIHNKVSEFEKDLGIKLIGDEFVQLNPDGLNLIDFNNQDLLKESQVIDKDEYSVKKNNEIYILKYIPTLKNFEVSQHKGGNNSLNQVLTFNYSPIKTFRLHEKLGFKNNYSLLLMLDNPLLMIITRKVLSIKNTDQTERAERNLHVSVNGPLMTYLILVKTLKPLVRAVGFDYLLNVARSSQGVFALFQPFYELITHLFRVSRSILNYLFFGIFENKLYMDKGLKSVPVHWMYHLLDLVVFFVTKLATRLLVRNKIDDENYIKKLTNYKSTPLKVYVKYLYSCLTLKPLITDHYILMDYEVMAYDSSFDEYDGKLVNHLSNLINRKKDRTLIKYNKINYINLHLNHPLTMIIVRDFDLKDLILRSNLFYVREEHFLTYLSKFCFNNEWKLFNQETKHLMRWSDQNILINILPAIDQMNIFYKKFTPALDHFFVENMGLWGKTVVKGGNLDYIFKHELQSSNISGESWYNSRTNIEGNKFNLKIMDDLVGVKKQDSKQQQDMNVLTSMLALRESNFLIRFADGATFSFDTQIGDKLADENSPEVNENQLSNVVVYNDLNYTYNYENVDNHVLVTANEINLWTCQDLTGINQLLVNRKSKHYKVKQGDYSIKTITLGLLNRYPRLVRPYINKMVYGHFNSISTRFNEEMNLIKNPKINVIKQLNTLKKVAFNHNSKSLIENFGKNKVTFDLDATIKWLKKSPYTNKIIKELQMFLEKDLNLRPINETKIIMKIEGILKDDPWDNLASQKNRIVMWQYYCVCALFSPIINELKKRFKSLLNGSFLYVDGSTPQQIDQWLQTHGVHKQPFFVETDFSKQDVNTHRKTLEVEMQIYSMLGMSKEILEWWSTVHNKWQFDSKHVKGCEEGKRQTGSVTTAFGNLLNNFNVNLDLFNRNLEELTCGIMVGDDNLAVFKKEVATKQHEKHCAVDWNQKCKVLFNANGGKFAGGIVYLSSNGSLRYGPDLVRMCMKAEVTNGVSDLTPENHMARVISYCYQIGRNQDTLKLLSKLGNKEVSENLPNWVEYPQLIESISKVYDISPEQVWKYYSQLISFLALEEPMKVDFKITSDKKF